MSYVKIIAFCCGFCLCLDSLEQPHEACRFYGLFGYAIVLHIKPAWQSRRHADGGPAHAHYTPLWGEIHSQRRLSIRMYILVSSWHLSGQVTHTHALHGWVDPANTRWNPNVALMLGQRRRRWSDIKATLGRCLVLAGFIRIYQSKNHWTILFSKKDPPASSLLFLWPVRKYNSNQIVGVIVLQEYLAVLSIKEAMN